MYGYNVLVCKYILVCRYIEPSSKQIHLVGVSSKKQLGSKILYIYCKSYYGFSVGDEVDGENILELLPGRIQLVDHELPDNQSKSDCLGRADALKKTVLYENNLCPLTPPRVPERISANPSQCCASRHT